LTYLTISNNKLPRQKLPPLTDDRQMVPSGIKELEEEISARVNPKNSITKKSKRQ